MKRLVFPILVAVLCLIWLHGSVFPGGTVSNTHFRSDQEHQSTDPHTRFYECRLDSGIAWGTIADSNQMIASWYTPWVSLGPNRIGFTYIFRMTRVDTTLTMDDNDSIWISIETSSNLDSWYPNINTIHEFDPKNDTGTYAKHFPSCSATTQTLTGFVRTEIIYHCWQDSANLGSIKDTLTHVPMLFEETIIPVD